MSRSSNGSIEKWVKQFSCEWCALALCNMVALDMSCFGVDRFGNVELRCSPDEFVNLKKHLSKFKNK